MKEGTTMFDESIRIVQWNSKQKQRQSANTTVNFNNQMRRLESVESNEEAEMQAQLIQVRNIQGNFKMRKGEQIQKFKNLKAQYQQIRGIKTDYGGQASRVSSSHSSVHSQIQKKSKVSKETPLKIGRQNQIAELERKQMEMMLQNSMKKIEQLLHKQMQYKKVIHELKLQKQNRPQIQSSQQISSLSWKKQKDYSEQVKHLQLQRQTFTSNVSNLKQRIKYLQNSMSNSEIQIRRLIQQKKNYQQIIRSQRDKYMSLQIDLRRQRMQHEIAQKEYKAELNQLEKHKQIKQTQLLKQLKYTISNLQEQIKLKDNRYALLLQQLKTSQKQIKIEDKSQVKIFHQFNNNLQTDNSNKIIQQTLGTIFNKLIQIQRKPIINTQNFSTEHETIQYLQKKIIQYQKRDQQYKQFIRKINNDCKQVKQQLIKIEGQKHQLQLKILKYSQNQSQLRKQINYYKQLSSRTNQTKKQPQIKPYQSKKIQIVNVKSLHQFFPNQQINQLPRIKQLQGFINHQKIIIDRQQQQLRQLGLKINKLQFQNQKYRQEGEFKLALIVKQKQARIEALLNQVNHWKKLQIQQHQQLTKLKQQYFNYTLNKNQQIQNLNNQIQKLLKQKNKFDEQIKISFDAQHLKSKQEYNLKIMQQMNLIQSLNKKISSFQDNNQLVSALQKQNQYLIQTLKKSRFITLQTDKLWALKQQQYRLLEQSIKTGKIL